MKIWCDECKKVTEHYFNGASIDDEDKIYKCQVCGEEVWVANEDGIYPLRYMTAPKAEQEIVVTLLFRGKPVEEIRKRIKPFCDHKVMKAMKTILEGYSVY